MSSPELLTQIKTAVKKRYDEPRPRSHLGCSVIGGECLADLWHQFHWSIDNAFDPDTHLLFQDGHRSEKVMADYIRLARIKLLTADKNGVQFNVTALGGHFRGSVDGILPDTMPWCDGKNQQSVWEHKAVNDKRFKEFCALSNGDKVSETGLKEFSETYYAQAQCYMHLLGMKWHWLTCSTAGVRNFKGMVTAYNRDYAEAMLARAELIITSQTCPDKAFKSPEFFKAKFLNSYDVLYKDIVPKPHCRNSLNIYPVIDDSDNAIWFDYSTQSSIPLELQSQMPANHLWNPTFIPYASAVESEDSDKPRWVKYVTENGLEFYNCIAGLEKPNAFNSIEMMYLTPEILADKNIALIRSEWKASLVGVS